MASPMMISIGLHYYTTPAEWHPERIHMSACQNALGEFVDAGLLRKLETPNEYGGTYEPTPGLETWVKALCAVPWPVQQWVILADSDQ